MKKILITGASGFIGSVLVKKLVTQGHQVFAIVRPGRSNLSTGVTAVIYDGTYESLERSLTSIEVDQVVHLATLFRAQHKAGEISELVKSNITFGTHLLDWMSKGSCKQLINVGTYAQYMDGDSERPQNLYSATKTAFEKIVDFYREAFSIRVLNLYFYDSYGPCDPRPKLLNLILGAIQKGDVLKMSPGQQEICYVYVEDVVRALLLGLERVETMQDGERQNFSVFSETVLTVQDLAVLAQKVVGRSFSPQFGGYPYRPREIFKFSPPYPLLPGWKATTSLEDGILSIWKEMNHDS